MPKKLHSSRKGPQGRELRDLDLEIRFLEGIVRRDPGYVEALQILGDNYTRRGLYVEGLKIDERLVRLRPDDSIVHYNLACSYSRTRQIDAALDSLRAAVKYIERIPDEGIVTLEVPFGAIIIYDIDAEGHMVHKEVRQCESTVNA